MPSTSPLSKPLAQAAERFGLDLPNLKAAAMETSVQVAQAKEALKKALGQLMKKRSELDIVAFGSLARHEMTKRSDFDYLILAYELVDNPQLIVEYRAAAEAARKAIGALKPGATGLFGTLVAAPPLVDLIGLEGDTNESLTRRILLLEESVSLTNSTRYPELLEVILDRYLFDYKDARPRVPRFLLNDIVRYWRTVAVDYQAKRWREGQGEKWGLRYLKLIITRKIAFAGSLAALFLPRIAQEATTSTYLAVQFGLPPLARLAQLQNYVPESTDVGSAWQGLKQVLLVADWFQGRMADRDFRESVMKVQSSSQAAPQSRFAKAEKRADELQLGLERLFLSPEVLVGSEKDLALSILTARYLTF